MKVSALKRFLKDAHSLKNQNVLIVSDAGIGKSQLVQQVANELNIKFIDFRGAYLERPDIIGMPVTENGVTKYYINSMLNPLFSDEGGILLIDEINRADVSVINCMMQLCTDRKINDYVVNKNWLIVAAINPTDAYTGTTELDCALQDRFIQIELEYDKKEMIDYLTKKHGATSSEFIGFLNHSFNYKKPNEVNNLTPYISPRKLDTACLYCGNIENLNKVIGVTLANEYDNFIRDFKPVLTAEFKDIKKATKELKRLKDLGRNDLVAASMVNFNKDINHYTIDNFIALGMDGLVPVDLLHHSMAEAIFSKKINMDEFIAKMPAKLKDGFQYLVD